MPAASSNSLTHAPIPAAPHISTAKSPPLNPSPRRNLQQLLSSQLPSLLSIFSFIFVKSSKANRTLDNRQAAPPVVSDVPITKVKCSKANQAPDNCQAAPQSSAMSPSPSKSKVQPRPNFTAVENHERDVTHDLEMLDLGTTSQSSKSKKKMSIAMAASMASKKGVSGMKRKKPVKDNDGPRPSKRYKTLESIPTVHSFQPAKGKEKVISWPFVAWPLLTRLQTAKKTKVAKVFSSYARIPLLTWTRSGCFG
ncbi:hypothetical protein JB92DRAFT_2834367 [Gautieria morchelliformis]|nr:hypothetical protein JB92DRAFT_2834367 [Gautieria morchelliformis]